MRNSIFVYKFVEGLFFVIFFDKKPIKMNLLTKHLFNSFCSRHVSLYKLICNEISFISVQKHTFMTIASSQQSEVLILKSLRMRNVFTLPSIKHNLLNFGSKFTEVLENAFGSSKQKYFGYLWYNSLEVINVKEFFTLLEMPDTFYSRFKIIELHVWMLLYHLPQENRFDKLLRYGLIEAMWLDTEKRAKIIDEYNLNFKKNMRTLYFKFKLDLLLYDEGFYGNDMALANALWFCFFEKSDVDPRILEALVSYVRYQMNHLNKSNMKRLEKSGEGEIWLPLEPHVKKIFNKPN